VKSSDIRLVIAGSPLAGARDLIYERFPDIAAEYCVDGESLCRAVDALRPNVAFIAKDAAIKPEHWVGLLTARDVKWLSLGNVGFDHVPAWDRSHIKVTNCGGAAAEEMAEFVIAAIMMINAGMLRFVALQREKKWQPRAWTPLARKTLVAVGVGHIGSHLIRKARQAGMRVIAVRKSRRKATGAHRTLSIDELHVALEHADYVSIQAPLNEQTVNLFDATALKFMKPTAWLINVARAGLVNSGALLDALKQQRVGGAVLDVLWTEPLPRDSEFWTLDNVVITSHSSGAIDNYYSLVTSMFCSNLQRFKAGKPLKNLV
jgi:phosphoglycerate dehydrogenase-like enzyme